MVGFTSSSFEIEPDNKNIIMSPFKSSRDIQKKEGGPDISLRFCIIKLNSLYEPCHEETVFLHMRKQRRRSASR